MMGRGRTREKDSDLGFFAGLRLGLAVRKLWWTRTWTQVYKSRTLPIKKLDQIISVQFNNDLFGPFSTTIVIL